MNIVYDGHIFRWQKTGGVSRYFREIISRLPSDWEPTVLGVQERNGNLPFHPRLKVSTLASVRPRRFSQPLKKEWWKAGCVRNANVLHPTFYNLTGGLKFSDVRCPVVITVHDFIKARFPKLESDSVDAVPCQREAIQRATHLICVSKATERDLLDLNPDAAGKTSVIYHGCSFPVCNEPQSEEIFETPTFLYIGNRDTYKNFMFLLRAFSKACKSHEKIRLCVAGNPLNDHEKWQIHFLGIEDRVDSAVFPDDRSLQQLYRKSVGLLYPSRLEGFGIPPLEAMACGTLAVTSNATSLPEVVGDAGILLDPTDESAWTESILEVARAKIKRAEFIERGRKRAAALSWEKSTQAHVDIYKRLASAA
jgi:glycosyltransferase involved in cell wall biosynthesis